MFDVLISPEKPEGHQGDWWALHPDAEKFMVRIVSCDWGVEREPRLAIERLDAPASKGRVSLDDLAHRFSEIPAIARNCALAFPQNVQQLRDEGPVRSAARRLGNNCVTPLTPQRSPTPKQTTPP